MAGLQTQGFQAQLPPIPVIPDSLGKVDVKSIYDRVVQGLQTGDAIRTETARQKAEDEQLKLAQQTALAGQAVLPSETAAKIGQSNVLAAQNSPGVATRSGALASDRLDTLLADTAFQNTLSPQQRVILASKGVPTTSTFSQGRGPNGELTQTAIETAQLPGAAPQPISTSTSTGAAPFALAPAGPGGISLGTLVSNGKGGQEVVHAPPAMLQNVVGTEPIFLGTKPNASGVLEDEYIIREFNAMGGTRDGAKFTQASGLPPPMATGIRAFAATGGSLNSAPASSPGRDQILKNAQTQAMSGKMQAELNAKNKLEALNDIAASAESTSALQSNIEKADKAIQDYNKDAILPNVVRGNLGFLPSVQAVNAAKSQFVSDIMGKLRGAGRVTQQEVQYASDAYPGPTQAKEVQQQNIQYLRDLSETVAQRRAYEYNAIINGMTPADAKMAAIHQFKIPPPANYTLTPPPESANAGGGVPVVPATFQSLSPEDQQAITWARAHATDPRAVEILRLHPGQ